MSFAQFPNSYHSIRRISLWTRQFPIRSIGSELNADIECPLQRQETLGLLPPISLNKYSSVWALTA